MGLMIFMKATVRPRSGRSPIEGGGGAGPQSCLALLRPPPLAAGRPFLRSDEGCDEPGRTFHAAFGYAPGRAGRRRRDHHAHRIPIAARAPDKFSPSRSH